MSGLLRYVSPFGGILAETRAQPGTHGPKTPFSTPPLSTFFYYQGSQAIYCRNERVDTRAINHALATASLKIQIEVLFKSLLRLLADAPKCK